MQRVVLFNSKEVIEGVKNYYIDKDHYLWIDITDPMISEIDSIKQQFDVDPDILNAIYPISKKHQPAISILNNCYFTIFLEIKPDKCNELMTKEIYIFLGQYWLITVHSSEINLTGFLLSVLKNKI